MTRLETPLMTSKGKTVNWKQQNSQICSYYCDTPTVMGLTSQHVVSHTCIGTCRLCPGYFDSCVPTSRGPDAKTHACHQHIAYACTDVRKKGQCNDKIRFLELRIKCGIANSCPGTHTALQVPMHTCKFPQ